jgi:hypothetical protein
MSENDIRAIALFFYFALLDERRAVELAMSSLNLCNEKKKRYPELKNSIIIVMATSKIWENNRHKIPRGLPNTSAQSAWKLPANTDLGPWREFQKNAEDDELVSVIWSRILKYSDEDIAQGLELTQGTVRYRLAKAIRLLGGMNHQRSHARRN